MKALRFLFCLTLTLCCLSTVFPWLIVPAAVSAVGLVAVGRGERDAWLRRRYIERLRVIRKTELERLMDHQPSSLRETAEIDLDIDNPTSVIRRRRESGGLYVPKGPCECPAYPRGHRHAGRHPVIPGQIRRPVISELARMTPEQRAEFRTTPVSPTEMTAAQRQLFTALTQAPSRSKPVIKPCTEGGPCRAADREIVTDPRGHRVGSLCTQCNRRRAWLPYLENGTST